MLKKKLFFKLKSKIYSAILKAARNCDFPETQFTLERAQRREHGHFACNIAMVLARSIRRDPIEIAEKIIKRIDLFTGVKNIEIAPPGFINFYLSRDVLFEIINQIEDSGKNFAKKTSSKRCQIEFVSANPTGPLTVGHGRGAVIGDTIARILEMNGYEVEREYYFNDGGNQMRLLGESVSIRYQQTLGEKVDFPEDGYQGDYIREIAETIVEKYGNIYLSDPENPIFRKEAEKVIFEDIKRSLKNLDIVHDSFYNEKDLYKLGKIDETLNKLRTLDLIYDKDDAVWYRATKFGAEKDRVLVKSNGEPTYRLPDIAYHCEKFLRNYDLIVDVFGADHLATYPDVLSAITALGCNPEIIRVAIHQFVTFTREGKTVKMSTRKANFVTIDDLTNLVGADVVRYFFLMRGMNSHLNFDLTLAETESDENPVFYLQYGFARICNVLLHAEARGITIIDNAKLSIMTGESEQELAFVLSEFPEIIDLCGSTLEPQHLCNYLQKLATGFHKFYTEHRIVTEDIALSVARLRLCKVTKVVFESGLCLLGVSRPKRM